MDYGALEIELVGVLNGYFSGHSLGDVFEARTMPENQNELLSLFTKGECNVQYVDSTYSEPDSTSLIRQFEQVKVGVFMRTNTVKDEAGSYILIASVKKALLGYTPVDGSRMWITNYGGWNIMDGQIGDMIEFSLWTENQQVIVEPDNGEVGGIPTPPIDSENTTSVGGPLVQVDQELYDNETPPVDIEDSVDVVGP